MYTVTEQCESIIKASSHWHKLSAHKHLAQSTVMPKCSLTEPLAFMAFLLSITGGFILNAVTP